MGKVSILNPDELKRVIQITPKEDIKNTIVLIKEGKATIIVTTGEKTFQCETPASNKLSVLLLAEISKEWIEKESVVNRKKIAVRYGDISCGCGRVIFLDDGGNPLRSYGDIKNITETNEGRNVLNDLCVGASAYKNGGQVALVFKEMDSDEIQICIYDGVPIFKDPVPRRARV